MNTHFQTSNQTPALVIPSEFDSLSPPPLLLPGEDPQQHRAMREAVFADLMPQSAIEWLLAIDIAELSWEIRRYRILRHRLLEAYRQRAIESALRRIDMIGISPASAGEAEFYTLQNAVSWRLDPVATNEIEMRLATHGIDQHSVSMEVYTQARDVLMLFEGLLNSTQARRLIILKEIKHHRTENAGKPNSAKNLYFGR